MKGTLYLLLLIFITNQWSRYSIVYLGGVAIGDCNDDCKFKDDKKEEPLCPTYNCSKYVDQCIVCQQCYKRNHAEHKNIKYSTCITSPQYGLLVSFAFTLPFSFANLLAGRCADVYNRKMIVLMALCGWATATVLQGLSDGYTMLLISRLLMGTALAFSSPASYSMIGDMFPVEKRGSANGVYSLGVYLGGGLSSLCLVLGAAIGWRETSYAIAIIELILAGCLMAFVEEPDRIHRRPSQEGYTEITEEEEEEEKSLGLTKVLAIVFTDKPVCLLFIAAALRFFGGFASKCDDHCCSN